MAPQNDFFPVQSSLKFDESGQPLGSVTAQLDLSELASALAPRLRDPDADFTEADVVPRAAPANQTSGPHRYTIFVPHDEGAMINVGASRAPFGPGIGMATKSTIAMQAFEVPTSLNLGLAWEFWGIKIGGYSLLTEGHSAHTAKYQVTIASQESGASITAKEEVSLTSQEKSVSLAAKEVVSVTGKKLALHSITAPPLEASGWDTFVAAALVAVDVADTVAPLAGVKGNGEAALAATSGTINTFGGIVSKNAEALKDKWMAEASKHGTKALTHVAAIVALWLSYKKSFKEPTPGKTAWQVRASKFKTLLAAVKEAKAIYSDYIATSDSETPGVSIQSDSTIGVGAKGKVTINGDGGVAITGGFGGASVAGLSASVAGQKDASISGGLGVTVKALAGDVELASDLKGCSMKGKKDVVMSSETATAAVTGDLDAQLNSVKAKAFVHGKTGATVAAGPGAGFGLVVKPENLTLGKVANADNFGSTAADGAYSVLRMTDGAIQLKITSDSDISMTKSQVKFKTPKVDMSASGKVIIKGSTVEIC